jgi:hypothetical protein
MISGSATSGEGVTYFRASCRGGDANASTAFQIQQCLLTAQPAFHRIRGLVSLPLVRGVKVHAGQGVDWRDPCLSLSWGVDSDLVGERCFSAEELADAFAHLDEGAAHEEVVEDTNGIAGGISSEGVADGPFERTVAGDACQTVVLGPVRE